MIRKPLPSALTRHGQHANAISADRFLARPDGAGVAGQCDNVNTVAAFGAPSTTMLGTELVWSSGT